MLYRWLPPLNPRFYVWGEEENGRHFLFGLFYHRNGSAPALSGQICAEVVNKLVPENCNLSKGLVIKCSKYLKSKLQVTQNKLIRFVLNLEPRSHIGNEDFIKLNWLPVSDRVDQVTLCHVFKMHHNLWGAINDRFWGQVISNPGIDMGLLWLLAHMCKIVTNEFSVNLHN